LDKDVSFDLDFVDSWHDHPLLIQAFAEKLLARRERASSEMGTNVPVIFTAHSVPQQTITEGDPYETQARETAALVAREAGLAEGDWTFAFQSQGMSGGG
jgi:ferrochelatase